MYTVNIYRYKAIGANATSSVISTIVKSRVEARVTIQKIKS